MLTNFPVLFRAADKLVEAVGAAVFSLEVEPPLACGKLPSFPYVRPEDPEAFWNGLAESLANLVLI